MKLFPLVGVLAFLPFFLLAQTESPSVPESSSASSKAVPIDGIAAMVNSESISLSEVWMAAQYSGETVAALAFRHALTELENRKLVLQEYWKGDVRIPDHYLEQRMVAIVDGEFGGNLQALYKQLSADRMTYREWKDMVRDGVILDFMRMSHVDSHIHISPNAIREAYEKNFAAKNTTPDRIHVYLAALPAQDTEAVEAFQKKLEEGADFPALAKQYSKDPNAAKGGDYGLVEPQKEFAPDLANAVLALADGAHAGPVQISGTENMPGAMKFFLYRSGTQKGRVPSMEELWSQMENALRMQQRAERYERFVQTLREKASIREFVPESLQKELQALSRAE